MTISVFDLFKVGIGPSSSHTVGPMNAARLFVDGLEQNHHFDSLDRIQIDLYGSLGATGKGHGSNSAVLLGLLREKPDEVVISDIPKLLSNIKKTGQLYLSESCSINFNTQQDLIFHRKKSLPFHANGMTFSAFDSSAKTIEQKTVVHH